jgi:hypothetical protein
MKKHPTVTEDTGRVRLGRSIQAVQEDVNELVTRIRSDEDARSTWLERQTEYYLRRYTRKFRNTSYPWPGASDIVMPVIDMTIDRMKSTLSRVVFTRPVVTFEALKPNDFSNARNAEQFFNWLLSQGVDDFRQQVLIGLDSILQYGFCVFKVYWDFRTRNVKRVFRRQDLPRRYGDLLPDITQRLANEAFMKEPKSFKNRRKAAQRVSAEVLEALRPRLMDDLQLDPNDEQDSKAISSILSALKRGEDQVSYKSREIVSNVPRICAIDPKDLIVPGYTTEVQNAPRIAHKVFLTEGTFQTRARDHGWSKSAVKSVLDTRATEKGQHSSGLKRTHFDFERDIREGLISTHSDDLIEVWEVYWEADIDGDGTPERVSAPIHPDTSTLLRDPRHLPFEHGKWPFVQIKFEQNDNRFYSSRGVPEKIDDFDIEVTTRHRNKLNNMDMMVPTFTYRFGSEVDPDNIHYRPGEFYPVLNHDDIKPLEVPNRTISDEREENILMTWVQRYMGGLDTGLADAQNISEARTATEIQAIQRSASETLSYRGEIIQQGMRKVYNMVWDLWNQWGPEEVYLRVIGQPPKRLTKAEIQGDFEIIPVGTVTTTDPVLEAQKALARLQMLMQVSVQFPQGISPEWDIDLGEALKRFLDRDNLMDSQAIVRRRPQEEAQAIAQRNQQKEALRTRAEVNDPMSLEEARAFVADSKKELPFKGRQKIKTGR